MLNSVFKLLFSITILVHLSSCIDHTIKNHDLEIKKGNGIFIINEGLFQQANASVSYYDWIKDSLYQNVYETTNIYKLGDILQSINIIKNKVYFVINNSSVIQVGYANNLKKIKTIEGFVSPRKIFPVNNDKAYVSDLYSGKIYVVSLENNTIIKNITTNQWTENFTKIGKNIFVTCPWFYSESVSKKILIINSENDIVVDSLFAGYNPTNLVEDKNGDLWVLCAGNKLENIKGSIFKINPGTHEIIDSLIFDDYLNVFNTNLEINESKDTLYVLYNDIFKINTENKIAPQQIIHRNSENFYGMNIDNKRELIYVTDALDFAEKGNVYIYSKKGKLLKTLKTGYLPNSVFIY